MKTGDLLLAVDTSTQIASIALYDGVSVRAEMTWESLGHHTTELALQVAAMLDQANVQASALSGLAVALGPGSFMGLRIGMALVKGLAMARAIPLVGVPTLDVTAYAVRYRRTTLYATLQAGRGRICAAPYRWHRGGWRSAGEVILTTWEELVEGAEEGATFCGELDACGLEALLGRGTRIGIVSAAKRLRRAGYLAELGWKRLLRGEQDNLSTLQPIYLHSL